MQDTLSVPPGTIESISLKIAFGNRKSLGFSFLVLVRTNNIVLMIFGFVTALGTLGINVSALVAGLGLTGFALGCASERYSFQSSLWRPHIAISTIRDNWLEVPKNKPQNLYDWGSVSSINWIYPPV